MNAWVKEMIGMNELKSFGGDDWSSIEPQADLMPHFTDAGVCAKQAPTKYYVEVELSK